MSVRTIRTLGWVSFALTLGLLLAGETLNALAPRPVLSEFLRFYPVAFAFAIVGVLIVTRRPENRVGWAASLIGLLNAVYDVSQSYSLYAPSAKWMVWLASWSWYPGEMLMLGVLPLLFPDGGLPSRRWRPALWLAAVGLAAACAAAIGRSPAGLASLDAITRAMFAVAMLSWLASLVIAMSSLVVRYRRASFERRLQLKWFVNAVVVVIVLLFGSLAVGALILHGPPFDVPILDALIHLSFVTLAAAIGIAVLRYRLYDIDLIINKAILFGAMAAFITGVYVTIVVGAGALIGAAGKPNLALSILATAIVAVAFEPVREAVQRLANRLVYGKRATPYEVMTEFSDRAATALSAEDVLPKMAETAGRGVGAVRSRVRLFLPDGGERLIGWPAQAANEAFERNFPVVYRGESVGEIAVSKPPGEPLTPAESQLLTNLAAQAGLVLRNVRLTVELQARLEESSARAIELRAARQRLVAAGHVARSQLERNIQATTEPHLLSIAGRLTGARQLMQSDPAQAATVLNQLTAEANETLELLRDLARGIYPPLLVDKGLVAGLQAHLKKAGVPVRLETDPAFATTRFEQQVEGAVYFCCLEALQNVAEHARAAPTVIHLSAPDGYLEFTVTDAGPGFDPERFRPGPGLQTMTDRVRALGGTLEVRSAPGVGTTIAGRIPARVLEPAA